MKNGLTTLLLALAAAVLILAALEPDRVFNSPARLLYVETYDGASVDAAICLSGAELERVERCLGLYNAGKAKTVVVTGGGLEAGLIYYREGGSLASISSNWLLKNGVPESAIEVIERGTSTYGEAAAVRAFIEAKGMRSIVVVSSPYHMRRVSLVFRKVFRGSGIEMSFSPAKGFDEGLAGWWRQEGLVAAVFGEYVKLFIYAVKGYI
ncbi:MAG: YdcF family protein [Deltaproteobacteria bacterium]|nr:YdcF family protein [Deltaproteobacteria bacterium]MCL4873332.1 YdcF family protein [bacterium]